MVQIDRCRSSMLAGALFLCAALVAGPAGTGYAATTPQASLITPPGIRGEAHIEPGGQAPRGAVLQNPYAGNAAVAKIGATVFSLMHCAGCHGGGGAGWVGPSLADGRWIFGGSDGAVFQSIYYGRPNGMPAFGGVLGKEDVWMIVTYLRSLSPPSDVPTESWVSPAPKANSP